MLAAVMDASAHEFKTLLTAKVEGGQVGPRTDNVNVEELNSEVLASQTTEATRDRGHASKEHPEMTVPGGPGATRDNSCPVQ